MSYLNLGSCIAAKVTVCCLPHYRFGDSMPLIILVTLLLISSWFFSEVLVLVPLNFLNSLKPFSSLTLVVALLAFLWCFGE